MQYIEHVFTPANTHEQSNEYLLVDDVETVFFP